MLAEAPFDAREVESENIESSKLEWGPDLGLMSWNEGMEEITKLNEGLLEGEKKWRFPTVKESEVEFKKTRSMLVRGGSYWSGSDSYNTYGVRVDTDGLNGNSGQGSSANVRVVR